MKLHRSGPITDINMTPFVDIVLVILIIFLLTATVLLPRTFSISLPQATEATPPEKLVVIVSIDQEGRVALNGKSVELGEEFDQLFRQLTNGKEPQAVIAADKNARHGRLVAVIERLKKLQVQKIGIEVEQP